MISVIIPTHNPNERRLARTLEGLRSQTHPLAGWELIIVDNASNSPGAFASVDLSWHPQAQIVRENSLGLTMARQRGLRVAQGDTAVLVDDDNVLAPEYLATAEAVLRDHGSVGIVGGKSLPEFEREPLGWEREFFPLLALRDLGPEPLISGPLHRRGNGGYEYPTCAPIGAGMVLRRSAWEAWLNGSSDSRPIDRRGSDLTSSGDNDIVLSAMKAGWEVGYFPRLTLTHLIPAGRLEATYLACLNRGIQKSWMRVLSRHQANAWGPLSPTGARLRKIRAWFTYRAWQRPVGFIRWQGACGHFDGRVAYPRTTGFPSPQPATPAPISEP